MKFDDETIKKLTSTIKSFTEFVHYNIIEDVLAKQEHIEEPRKFFYSVLFKLNNGLDTVNHLIVNLYNKPHFTDSICILMRSMLADVLTFHYILHKSEENDDLENQIKHLYYGHVAHTIFYLNKVYRIIHNLSEKELMEKIDSLKSAKPEFFDRNGTAIFKDTMKVNPSSMVTYMFSNNTKNYNLEHLKWAFDRYDIFSKYEHFGDLSSHLIHRQFNDQNREEIFSEIADSVYIISLTIQAAVVVWPELLDKENIQLNKYLDQLHSFVPPYPDYSK